MKRVIAKLTYDQRPGTRRIGADHMATNSNHAVLKHHLELDPDAPSVAKIVEVLREAREGLDRWRLEDHPRIADVYLSRIDAMIARLEGKG